MYIETVRSNNLVINYFMQIYSVKNKYSCFKYTFYYVDHMLYEKVKNFLIVFSSQVSNNNLILPWKFNRDIYGLINDFVLFCWTIPFQEEKSAIWVVKMSELLNLYKIMFLIANNSCMKLYGSNLLEEVYGLITGW